MFKWFSRSRLGTLGTFGDVGDDGMFRFKGRYLLLLPVLLVRLSALVEEIMLSSGFT